MTGQPRRARVAATSLRVDVAVGAAVCVLQVYSAAYPLPKWSSTAPLAVGVAVSMALGAAVAGRRLFPVPALVVAAAATSASLLLGFQRDPFLAVALVLYVIATTRSSRTSIAALAATVVGTVVIVRLGPVGVLDTTAARSVGTVALVALTPAAVLTAAWALGFATRRQRAYRAAIGARAAEHIRTQQELAGRTVTEEKLRIARELHDVIAHSVGVMTIQAGMGHHVLDTQPEQARAALAAIETTGRGALDEMRRLLGVLRAEGHDADRDPSPDLSNLDDLVRRTGQAGVLVELHITGQVRSLPAGIELSAYRIIQEATTNVVKHAGVDRCTVGLDYTTDSLALAVTDGGEHAGAPQADGTGAGGHGLIGMRERATLHGGEFDAGPLPGRGYRVTARLPVGRTPG